ncbi:MAG: DUF1788 domain-containing protein [Planctomycetota bacterium]|nr:DUF1788 domain-containing protein [Planctomycetota bacterium]
MSQGLFASQSAQLQEAFEALRNDLIHDDGPRISTMRNYRFAILQYSPQDEFKVRGEVQRLVQDLENSSWHVLTISLQKLLFDRVRNEGDEWVGRVIEMEKRMHGIGPDRGLNYLRDRVAPLIEGPDGIAADCSRIICEHAEQHPDQVDRTVALIGRAGALYPFFRSSSLLKHLDGRTMNVPARAALSGRAAR